MREPEQEMVLLIIVHPWSEGVPEMLGPGEASAPNWRLTSRRWILDVDLVLKPSHHLLFPLHQVDWFFFKFSTSTILFHSQIVGGEFFPFHSQIVGGEQVVSGPGRNPPIRRRGPTGTEWASQAMPRKGPLLELQQQSSTDVVVALTDRFKDQHEQHHDDEW